MEAEAFAVRDPAVLEGAPPLRRDVHPGVRTGPDGAVAQHRIGALGDDHPGRDVGDLAVGELPAAAVVAEPESRPGLLHPAGGQRDGGPAADRDRRAADPAERAAFGGGGGVPVEDEQGVRQVVQRAVGEGEPGAVADPQRRVLAGGAVDLAGLRDGLGALVPDRQGPAPEVPDGGVREAEPGAPAQVGAVLRQVVHPAAGEYQFGRAVQGQAVAGDPVDLAVDQPPARL